MADPAGLTVPWRCGLKDRKTYTKEVARVQTALFLFSTFVCEGTVLGKGTQRCLAKDIEVPCLSYQPLSHPEKCQPSICEHPNLLLLLTICIAHFQGLLEQKKTKEALEIEADLLALPLPVLVCLQACPPLKALSHCFHMLGPLKLVQKHCTIKVHEHHISKHDLMMVGQSHGPE